MPAALREDARNRVERAVDGRALGDAAADDGSVVAPGQEEACVGVGGQAVHELRNADPEAVHALDHSRNGGEVVRGGGWFDLHGPKKIRRAGDAFVHRVD